MVAEATQSNPHTMDAKTETSVDQKIKEVQEIISAAQTVMLTSAGEGGHLHSRAMAPASKKGPFVFEFLANRESGKVEHDEVNKGSQVNIAVIDTKTTSWISVSGTSTVTDDRARVKELYNPMVSAWFGDLGDGKRDGSADDPRIVVITVEPSDIHYWYQQRTSVGAVIDIASSALTGKVATPGVLRTLSKAELDSARK